MPELAIPVLPFKYAMFKAGQKFRLASDIVAIENSENRMRALVIPSGNVLQITKYPSTTDDRMAEALWDLRPVAVFGRDLSERAHQIKAMSANHSSAS